MPGGSAAGVGVAASLTNENETMAMSDKLSGIEEESDMYDAFAPHVDTSQIAVLTDSPAGKLSRFMCLSKNQQNYRCGRLCFVVVIVTYIYVNFLFFSFLALFLCLVDFSLRLCGSQHVQQTKQTNNIQDA